RVPRNLPPPRGQSDGSDRSTCAAKTKSFPSADKPDGTDRSTCAANATVSHQPTSRMEPTDRLDELRLVEDACRGGCRGGGLRACDAYRPKSHAKGDAQQVRSNSPKPLSPYGLPFSDRMRSPDRPRVGDPERLRRNQKVARRLGRVKHTQVAKSIGKTVPAK